MPNREKHVMVYHYNPKKRFFLISLELENRPGTLGNLANLLGIRGINILEGYFGSREGERSGPMSFFVESTNPRLDEKWLKEFIETSVGVEDVEVKGSVEGFLADSLNFPLVWNTGDRAIVMRVEHMRLALDSARKLTGSDGAQMVYSQGFDYGKSTWTNLFTTFRPKSEAALSEVLQIYSAVGWGRLSIQDLNQKTRFASIKMTDSFECLESTGRVPTSHFIRGHLAGAMSAYFGSDVKALEKKCVSMGDTHCEFELSP